MTRPFALAVLLVALGVYAVTTAPTIYIYDSTELVIGAATLGLVHAPGYPLYLLAVRGFMVLPLGDVAYRANLFSALCMALTIVLLVATLRKIRIPTPFALAAAFIFGWSYLVWSSAVRAEVYAPQVMTFALTLWLLARLYVAQDKDRRTSALLVGLGFGVAVAMHPSTALFAPGIALAFVALRVPWRVCFAAAVISVGLFALSLLYFPFSYHAGPLLSIAGHYGPDGRFVPVDLGTLDGILWMIRGSQFGSLFHLMPSGQQLVEMFGYFWRNFVGIGIIFGVIGLVTMPSNFRRLWLVLFIPFTYFYTAYGATDRETMLAPAFLLWAVVIGFGLVYLFDQVEAGRRLRWAAALVFPVIMLGVNFPLLNVRDDHSIYDRAQIELDAMPQKARVFGAWFDILPLQYLQIIEGRRPDLTLYNLFLFDDSDLRQFLGTTQSAVFLGDSFDAARYGSDYRLSNIVLDLPARNQPSAHQPVTAAVQVTRP